MTIRILYIYGNAGKKPGSVQSKILSQIHYLNEAGLECRGAFFTSEVEREEKVNENINLLPFAKTVRKYFRHLAQTEIILEAVHKYLSEQENEYDLIYLRYTGALPTLLKIVRKFGHKICIEHNSKEAVEMLGLSKNFRPLYKIRVFLGFLGYILIPVMLEWTIGVLIRRGVLFATCVSSDMARYQKRLSFGKLKCFAIGNGINAKENAIRTSPAFNGTSLDILFLKGSSGNSPWNGLDRLINGMLEYHGPVNIRLHIVGNEIPGEVEMPPGIRERVRFTGYLEGTELDLIFNECHIACGTLGLYRSKQKENATLKVRNYIVRGIPFIYAYTDVDLIGKPEAKRWSLELENCDKPIDLAEVVKFAGISLYNGHEKEMRDFALKHLDYSVKMNYLARIIMTEVNKV